MSIIKKIILKNNNTKKKRHKVCTSLRAQIRTLNHGLELLWLYWALVYNLIQLWIRMWIVEHLTHTHCPI
jgi:hypothetical protein